MSHSPPGAEDHFPSPKRQAREGPGGDPSIDEVSTGPGGRGSIRALHGPNSVRCDDGKAVLAPETRLSSGVPSCAPAGNYGINGEDQGCYTAEEETPEAQDSKHGYDWNELEWRNIGSGAWARTFIGAARLPLTTRGGPCSSDIQRRIVCDALTNQLIDDCYDTTDAPHRPRDVRV